MGRYKALYEEGLIASEVYRDLTSKLENAQDADAPPRFDIGLDTERLIARLDLFAALEAKQLEGVRKLLRARFTVPNELIVRKGERGDAVYFIASGAVEVIFSDRRIPLGSGDFFGEMALITGEPRQRSSGGDPRQRSSGGDRRQDGESDECGKSGPPGE